MKNEEYIFGSFKRLLVSPRIILPFIASLAPIATIAFLFRDKLYRFTDILPIALVFFGGCLGISMSYLVLIVRQKSKRVFLCYSSNDKHVVEGLTADLRTTGYTILDPDKSILVGENIKEKVSKLIEHSSCIIVFVSKNMVNSKWVREELDIALRKNKTILPVKIDDSPVPGIIRNLKHIYTKDDYDEALEMIHRSVRSAVRKPEIPKKGEHFQEVRPTPETVDKSNVQEMQDKNGMTPDSNVMNERFQYCIKRISNKYKEWQWN